MTETALAGCTEFNSAQPERATAPEAIGGSVQVDEAAESLTIYRVL
jgi:hypothetical protein